MLAPVRTVEPTDYPVTLAEAKQHLRVGEPGAEDVADPEDPLIEALIQAATDHLDGYTGVLGRALMPQTWRQDYSAFCHQMRLPLAPAMTISSVTYYDAANAQQTLSSDVYQLLTDAKGPFVALIPDQTWPGTYRRPDAVAVTFEAGAEAAPASIKAAILLMVGDLFANRETSTSGAASAIPMSTTVDALIRPWRRNII